MTPKALAIAQRGEMPLDAHAPDCELHRGLVPCSCGVSNISADAKPAVTATLADDAPPAATPAAGGVVTEDVVPRADFERNLKELADEESAHDATKNLLERARVVGADHASAREKAEKERDAALRKVERLEKECASHIEAIGDLTAQIEELTKPAKES